MAYSDTIALPEQTNVILIMAYNDAVTIPETSVFWYKTG
jgi:hypothetical protein